MKHVRFYQDGNDNCEMHGGKKTFPYGFNGLAILGESLPRGGFRAYKLLSGSYEALASIYAYPGDGPYCSTGVSHDYLRKQCRRISEKKARELFPELFRRLE